MLLQNYVLGLWGNQCNGWVFTCSYLLRLLEKHNVLHLSFSVFFCFSATFFLEYRGIRSIKYFTDQRKANTVQLFIATKRNFSSLFFFFSSLLICYIVKTHIKQWTKTCLNKAEQNKGGRKEHIALAAIIYFGQVFVFCRLIKNRVGMVYTNNGYLKCLSTNSNFTLGT